MNVALNCANLRARSNLKELGEDDGGGNAAGVSETGLEHSRNRPAPRRTAPAICDLTTRFTVFLFRRQLRDCVVHELEERVILHRDWSAGFQTLDGPDEMAGIRAFSLTIYILFFQILFLTRTLNYSFIINY